AAFRYRTYTRNKTELMIIMTPHIIRNRHDAERITSEETRRIDWVLGNVMHVHGTANCAPLVPAVLPEMQSKAPPSGGFRIYPGAAKTTSEDRPAQPAKMPEIIQSAPAPTTPSRAPIFRGGLLQKVLMRQPAGSVTV